MAENNKRRTRNKLKAPRNNIRKTGAPIDSKKLKSQVKRMSNDVKRMSRRDYITRTARAGADEFNDTKIRAKKGGPAYSTKDLARFNRNKLIAKAGKGLKRGRMGTTVLELAARAAEYIPGYGKKVKKARKAQEAAKERAYRAGLKLIGR